MVGVWVERGVGVEWDGVEWGGCVQAESKAGAAHQPIDCAGVLR